VNRSLSQKMKPDIKPPKKRKETASEKRKLLHYRPSSKVTVNTLLEQVSGLLEEEALLEGHLLRTKAGCLGFGRVAASLPSMKTTLDIVGRSLGSSCTHKSPTFTHFKYSFVLQLPDSVWSIKSSDLSSFHKCHACRYQLKVEVL
jgi:hypothetical protein